VISLEPHTLDQVLDSIVTVGDLAGAGDRALALVSELRARLQRVREAVKGRPRRRVLTLEWLDPPFVGGHWVPEMVAIAGGDDVLGHAGMPSRDVTWQQVSDSDPVGIVAMPCGFDAERALQELETAALPSEWKRLRAVQTGEVYAVDGSAHFSRPGPRLVDGVEILASILHPEVFNQVPAKSRARVPLNSLHLS
jgi:iron complex transport system substrate-binding protein